MGGPPLPVFPLPFDSLTVLAPASGSRGVTNAPEDGLSAAFGSYSAALLGLKVKLAETSAPAAIFSASGSVLSERSGSPGPLTVARLFRLVLCSRVRFDRLDFAIYCPWVEGGLLK